MLNRKLAVKNVDTLWLFDFNICRALSEKYRVYAQHPMYCPSKVPWLNICGKYAY